MFGEAALIKPMPTGSYSPTANLSLDQTAALCS
jgi:hypothetical protein